MIQVVLPLVFHHLIDAGVLVLPVQFIFHPDIGVIVKKLVPLLSISLLTIQSIFLLLITNHELKFLVILILNFLYNLKLPILFETEVDFIDKLIVLLDRVLHLVHLVSNSLHLLLSIFILHSLLYLFVFHLNGFSVTLPVLCWRWVGVRMRKACHYNFILR